MKTPAEMSGSVAELLDEECGFSLAELCRLTRLSAEQLIEMVDEGVLEPAGSLPAQWRFPAPALRRAQIAVRLQRDLHVNLAGTAVVLELLDEVRELRARLRVLEQL